MAPEDSGKPLGAIVLRHLPILDQWDWGSLEPLVCLDDYPLRGKGTRGLAMALPSGSEEDLNIQFNQEIELLQALNIVFCCFDPQSSIRQWSTELLLDGENLVRYLRPTLRLNIYEQDMFH